MIGWILGFKGKLIGIVGAVLAVLGVIGGAYLKGKQAEKNKQRVREVKEYHKHKEKLTKVKQKVKDQSAKKDREDIQKRLKKLREYKS